MTNIKEGILERHFKVSMIAIISVFVIGLLSIFQFTISYDKQEIAKLSAINKMAREKLGTNYDAFRYSKFHKDDSEYLNNLKMALAPDNSKSGYQVKSSVSITDTFATVAMDECVFVKEINK